MFSQVSEPEPLSKKTHKDSDRLLNSGYQIGRNLGTHQIDIGPGHACMDAWTHGRMDACMDGWMCMNVFWYAPSDKGI